VVVAGIATQAAERILVDQAKIVVNDRVITQREFASYTQLRVNQLRQEYEGEALQQRVDDLGQLVTDELVETLLLESRAAELGIEVSDRELESRVSTILRRQPQLSQQFGEEEVKRFVVKQLLRRNVMQQEVLPQIHVSDARLLEACRNEERQNREIEVGHILIRGHDEQARDTAQDVREELEAGASFEETALEFSEDPSVEQNKGRLGFISRGQFVKAFEDVAFRLEVGALSEPVETRFGYHVIKVFDERSKAPVDCDNMDAVTRGRLHDQMFQRLQEERLNEYLADLRQKAEIHVYDRS